LFYKAGGDRPAGKLEIKIKVKNKGFSLSTLSFNFIRHRLYCCKPDRTKIKK